MGNRSTKNAAATVENAAKTVIKPRPLPTPPPPAATAPYAPHPPALSLDKNTDLVRNMSRLRIDETRSVYPNSHIVDRSGPAQSNRPMPDERRKLLFDPDNVETEPGFLNATQIRELFAQSREDPAKWTVGRVSEHYALTVEQAGAILRNFSDFVIKDVHGTTFRVAQLRPGQGTAIDPFKHKVVAKKDD